jgi:hypothetical protein
LLITNHCRFRTSEKVEGYDPLPRESEALTDMPSRLGAVIFAVMISYVRAAQAQQRTVALTLDSLPAAGA